MSASWMALLKQGVNRVRSFFRKGPLDGDLNEEMAAHLDFAIEENLQRGLSPTEARRQALIRFGNLVHAQERQREARGLPGLDILLQDLSYTFRTLRRDKSFTVIAVLILALGIGANIAVFSVVDTILLRPLPFHDPDKLVRIGPGGDNKGGMSTATYTADAYERLVATNRSFQDVTGYYAFSASDNVRLTGRGVPLPVTGLAVVGNFFQTLGVEPAMGRLFTPDECRKNGRKVVLLSHASWQRQFGADTAIVGKAVTLDGDPYTVVGILPESFDFGSVFQPAAKVDLFVPEIMQNISEEGNTLALFARLRPGVSLAQAQAEADLLFPTLPAELTHPEWKPEYTGHLMPLKDYVSGKLRSSLIVLWSAVGLILLIVCVNLSNLLLARAATRRKEFALRNALGAGRNRIIRQLLTESLVLSALGAMLGLGLAYSTTYYLAHQGSLALPLMSSVRVDSAALGWTLLITIATALLFGLLPAFRLSDNDLQDALKDTGQGMSGGRSHDRVRSALVISEVALACVLLVGAGLLLRSFLHVIDIDLGFEPSRAAAVKVDSTVDFSGTQTREQFHAALDKQGAVYQQVIRRVQAIPGVEMAGITDNLPLDRNRSWGIQAKGVDYHKGELQATFVYIVTPGYLKSIGMRLTQGRDFTWDDRSSTEGVVIINKTVARKLWPGQDPVGRVAQAGGNDKRVIGVIDDVQTDTVEGASGWQMYLPITQEGPEGAELVVRSKLPTGTLAGSVMSTLRQLNPGQAATEFRPVQRIVDHAVSGRGFFVLLVSIFAGLGLALASLGIYGVISYSVTQQTKEIGIRMALGATAEKVQFGVIAKTLRMAAMGILVGTLGSFVASRLIASMLFGTAPSDPLTFAGMILSLGLMAFLAGYIPARRASRIDPMVALRAN